MSSIVTGELDALILEFLMVVEHLDLLETFVQVILVEEEGVLALGIGHFGTVSHDESENGLGRVRHEDLALEPCLLEEVRYGPAVVQVEVGDEEEVDGGRVDVVEHRKGLLSLERHVDPAVKHDRLPLVLQVHTGTPHFLACPERHYSQNVIAYFHLIDSLFIFISSEHVQ